MNKIYTNDISQSVFPLVLKRIWLKIFFNWHWKKNP